MRLLIVMPISSPWSRNLAKQIYQLGHEVYVFDPSSRNCSTTYLNETDSFQKESIVNFIQTVSLVTTNRSFLGYYAGMIKAIFVMRKVSKSFKPHALIVLSGSGWSLLAYLSRIKPFVVYVVGSDILLKGIIKRWINRIVLNASAQVFSNGFYLGNEARKLAPKAIINDLYLGINTEHFTIIKEKKKFPIIIICTRGFKSIYNNKYLIDGLSEISLANIPDIKIIFTSSGPLLEEIKEYANTILKTPMLERVEFLGGVSDTELKKALQYSHIYISLSKSDGASISLMEALSCGLFPILSDIPANREWIKDQNGILVPLSNPKILASEILRAIVDVEWRLKATKYNREFVLEMANTRKNTELFIKAIEQVIYKIRI